ncbi:hypothetical protein KFE25_002294 [Diacronema lutheri]|uniref:Polycystin cation channel PKD1/PKD2 domain-containing protein n=1 Tax=Diacronema lutheri TaxID=2081491 RepID=A0A8J5XA93_DIALT|nr:hypothetical protein KFE25_002294 [Diacronema lutheri]
MAASVEPMADVDDGAPPRPPRRLVSAGNKLTTLFSGPRYVPQDPRAHAGARLLQAYYRGHIVRRLRRSVVQTAEVRRAVGRLRYNRRGFCELLLYLAFCALICTLFALQHDVVRAYAIDAAARAKVDTIVAPDGTTWDRVGVSPDQLFVFIETAHGALYEDDERFVVNLDKWAREADGAARVNISAVEALAALEASNATSTQLAEAAAAVALEASLPPVDGVLGARCNAAPVPSCCRLAAWRRGMAARDFTQVSFVHNFGHNRIAGPLFVKQVRAARSECTHAAADDDPVNALFTRCYSGAFENSSRLVRSGLAESETYLWQSFLPSEAAYVMALDLGLYKLPRDQGLCQLETARDFGWVDTGTKRVQVEWVTYNGHFELWTLTRLQVSWGLGGNPEVDLETLTAPLRNLYARPADAARAAFEGVYVLLLGYYMLQTAWHVRTLGLGSLLSGWGIVDLAAYALAVLNIVLWVKFAVEGAQYRMPDFVEKQGTYAPDSHELWGEFMENLGLLETAEDDFVNFTIVQSVLLMVLTFRLFKFLAFHQQFSLVTATLLRAGASLAHFLVVFAIVLVMYAFVGFNMLGHKLERYNTLGKAINSMCSMLVFDDTVSFADIMDVAPLVGPVFYWSYFILSSLMLINVLLAILLDAYASVSRASRTTNFIWVDLIVQYRLFRTSLTDRSVYPSLVRAEERVRVVGFKRTHLNLAQAYSLLQLEQLPSFAVWNLVLVLERKAMADAEETSMAEQVESLHRLSREMAAQLKQTHKLVAHGQ